MQGVISIALIPSVIFSLIDNRFCNSLFITWLISHSPSATQSGRHSTVYVTSRCLGLSLGAKALRWPSLICARNVGSPERQRPQNEHFSLAHLISCCISPFIKKKGHEVTLAIHAFFLYALRHVTAVQDITMTASNSNALCCVSLHYVCPSEKPGRYCG